MPSAPARGRCGAQANGFGQDLTIHDLTVHDLTIRDSASAGTQTPHSTAPKRPARRPASPPPPAAIWRPKVFDPFLDRPQAPPARPAQLRCRRRRAAKLSSLRARSARRGLAPPRSVSWPGSVHAAAGTCGLRGWSSGHSVVIQDGSRRARAREPGLPPGRPPHHRLGGPPVPRLGVGRCLPREYLATCW